MKKIIKYHLNIYKKYMLDQNLEGVAQKVRLPRPSEVQNWKGHGRLNFWARALKFFTDTYFLKIFKWYLDHFFISVMICHLPKSWKAYYSRCCVFHAVSKPLQDFSSIFFLIWNSISLTNTISSISWVSKRCQIKKLTSRKSQCFQNSAQHLNSTNFSDWKNTFTCVFDFEMTELPILCFLTFWAP